MTQVMIDHDAMVWLMVARIPVLPKIRVRYIVHSAKIDGINRLTFRLCNQTPIAKAMGICTMQGKIAAGYCLKTEAITSPKIASTIVRAMNRIKRKSNRTRLFRTRPATSPTVCPGFSWILQVPQNREPHLPESSPAGPIPERVASPTSRQWLGRQWAPFQRSR